MAEPMTDRRSVNRASKRGSEAAFGVLPEGVVDIQIDVKAIDEQGSLSWADSQCFTENLEKALCVTV